jgi:hypothetical protein
MSKLLMSFLAVTLVLYGAAVCMADDYGSESLQCNSGTISLGNPKAEVLSKCGPPTSKSVQPDLSENWMYNFGSTDFIYTLNFIGDQLNTIQRGGRGF